MCDESTFEFDEVLWPDKFSLVPLEDLEFLDPLVDSLAEFNLLLAIF